MDSCVYFIVVFFICLVPKHVCQVCNETRSVYRETPETFQFSYIEPYEEPCVIFCSVKTRKSVNITTRMVQTYENITVNVCCEGYIEDDSHESDGLYCEPVCDPPCQNGYCRKPNQCACEAGYALDPLDSHVCRPLCLQGCEIPSCISIQPSQCSNSSYDTPVCTIPCSNGVCIGPNICQCLPGFYSTSANTCEATALSSYSCQHGTLIIPETCLCDLGWEWKCGYCHPVCNECDHGTCVSPGQCECEDGYVKNDERECVPHCSGGCENGKCISPELCSCDPGWYKTSDDGSCLPHCDMNCDDGDCVAPNICDCHMDYQLYMNRGKSRCVPNRKACKDGSSSPESCTCDAPYEVAYFKDDGSDCICLGPCIDSSSVCTKATCLFMNVVSDTSMPEIDYDYDSDEEGAGDSSDGSTNEDDDDETTREDNTDHNHDEEVTTFSITENIDNVKNTLSPDDRTEIIEIADENKRYFPNNTTKTTKPVISVYWIIGAVVVGVVFVLAVLALIIKRCKTRSMNAGNRDPGREFHTLAMRTMKEEVKRSIRVCGICNSDQTVEATDVH